MSPAKLAVTGTLPRVWPTEAILQLADPVGRGEESEPVLAARAALIEQAGGRSWTQDEARRQHKTALAALDEVPMADDVREHFVALAEFVVVRER